MFTGIVDHCGSIQSIDAHPTITRLTITHQFNQLSLGESIAVDGVCLTVTAFDEHQFECELSSETMRLTTASQYVKNQRVNLERAMQLSDRMGGHLVTGHVDSTLLIKHIEHSGECNIILFSGVLKQFLGLISRKGCIAINGVSLTINDVFNGGFSVMLIPHTLARTNLSTIKMNDVVNVEFDSIAKLVERQLFVREVTHESITD